MKPTLLILAAGIGSRYGGLKQVDPIGPNGEAIIDYSIFDAIRTGYGKVVFVIRESFADAFKETFDSKLKGRIETAYAYQELDSFVPKELTIHPDRKKPWGTGHAILVAKDIVHEPFVVINADDFYGSAAYKMIPEFLSGAEKHDKPHYCMVGYGLKNTLSEYGFVSRGVCETDADGFLTTVVERTNIEKENGKIVCQLEGDNKMELSGNEVVSMNIWGFTPSYFRFLETYFDRFIRENASNPKGEFYIPFVVNELINQNKIRLKVLESQDHWFGVTYKEDKEMAVNSIRNLINKGIYPEKLWK
jgi:UTP-glucose-1-phosphate uridylyltransferase